MIETKERKIGESLYMVTQLPARRALRLKAKLIRLFGPTLAQLILTSLDKEEKKPEEMTEGELAEHNQLSAIDKYRLRDMQKASFVKGIQLLAQSLDDKTFDELCMEIIQGVRRDGVELTTAIVDTCFSGKLMEFYTLIAFVLEVNFSDFFFAMKNTGSQMQEWNTASAASKKTYTFRSEKSLPSGD